MRENLMELLKAKNLRPSVFAREIGLNPSTVDDILKGKTNEMNIGVEKILKMANYLGVSVEELYEQREPRLSKDEGFLLDLWNNSTDEGKRAAIVLLKGYQKKE